jgi:plastocyanin
VGCRADSPVARSPQRILTALDVASLRVAWPQCDPVGIMPAKLSLSSATVPPSIPSAPTVRSTSVDQPRRRAAGTGARWATPLLIAFAVAGFTLNCGGDDPAPATPPEVTAGAGGTAGEAGAGGDAAAAGSAGHNHELGGSDAGASGEGGGGGAAAGGSDAGAAGGSTEDPLVIAQGCEGKFEDRSDAAADRTIEAFGVAWKPPCMEIAAGQTITWAVDFTTHPLHRGTRADENAGSADNPIPNSDSGSNAAVTFPTPGLYPFYCVYHATPDGKGMVGLVRVKLAGYRTKATAPVTDTRHPVAGAVDPEARALVA